MSDEKKMGLETTAATAESDQTVHLEHGRTLEVSSTGADQVLEIRGGGGQVELRITMTEAGPVLQVEGVRLQVKASESIDLECKRFKLDASESIDMATKGELSVRSEGELNVESSDNDVRVRGKLIWLN